MRQFDLPMTRARHVNIAALLFTLFAAPAAWFLQLCAGFALASTPCFRDGERMSLPAGPLQWTSPAMILIMLAAITIALVSLALSWRALNAARIERTAGAPEPAPAATERARFLALWGVILAGGFALATALTALAFMVLPRCAG
jgi:hypothetical protein